MNVQSQSTVTESLSTTKARVLTAENLTCYIVGESKEVTAAVDRLSFGPYNYMTKTYRILLDFGNAKHFLEKNCEGVKIITHCGMESLNYSELERR